MRRIPCELVRCNPMIDEKACGLLQMKHTVPPQILYAAYWYRSGTNNTMRDHLRRLAEETTQILAKQNATVLDIGCNDGTLLSCYPAGFVKYGIDPQEEALKRGETPRDDSWGREAREKWGTLYCSQDAAVTAETIETLPGDYRLLRLSGNARRSDREDGRGDQPRYGG